ncbi:hypothetical protein M433DRAFT_140819 [Acidomyces richmondensis BFW]|nr:MAG: hypothetical protein FE78DRAFT_76962 [Acidomyces sp. 'richmondensis']KYG48673.1 hypothetical protein M433DRAFT_140819 [Acidomyces richmondensis BFW]
MAVEQRVPTFKAAQGWQALFLGCRFRFVGEMFAVAVSIAAIELSFGAVRRVGLKGAFVSMLA